MHRHGANFHLALLHLGQNEDRRLVIEFFLSSRIKSFRIQEANFSKEWT